MNYIQSGIDYIYNYTNLKPHEQNLQALKHVAYGAWSVSAIAISGVILIDYLPTEITKISLVSIAAISFVGGTYLLVQQNEIGNNISKTNLEYLAKPFIYGFNACTEKAGNFIAWLQWTPANTQYDGIFEKAKQEFPQK